MMGRILGGIPLVVEFPDGPDPLAATWSLQIRSLNGEDVLPFTGNEVFLRQGIEGLDLPPVDVIRETVPGLDGSRLREIRTLEREVFLPLFVRGTSHQDLLVKRDRLASLIGHEDKDYALHDGTCDLVALSLRGTQAVERRLRVTYTDGMKGSRAADAAGSYWESLGLTFLACRPYWEGEPWETPRITIPVASKWFGRFPGRLSSSRALGSNIPIQVRGDGKSWATVDLGGPASSVTVTGPGLSISIPAGLANGETARVVTDPRGRTATFGGVKQWSRVAPTMRFQPMSPGAQELSIVMAGATDASFAVVSGSSWYKRPW